LFQILDILVNAANLFRDVDALRTVLVTLLATYAMVSLALLLYGSVISYKEGAASLAVVLIA
jgi:hypothetical protein